MDHEIEIAILPTVRRGLTYEDVMLGHWGPCFGPVSVLPTDAFARTLSVLGIGKEVYVAEVQARTGIDLFSAHPSTACGKGPWAWMGKQAGGWKRLHVPNCGTDRAPLLGCDQLFEVLENATYGGVLAVAGYAAPALVEDARSLRGEVLVRGTVQIGIIDYLWGSGHSVSRTTELVLDLAQGQIIDEGQMCHSWDSCCLFDRRHFRFESIEKTERREPAGAHRTAA